MGKVHHTCTVGQAAGVSDTYMMFMLCTWRFGGVAEGGKGEGKVKLIKVLMGNMRCAHCGLGYRHLHNIDTDRCEG